MTRRIAEGRSPFSADRTHLHHRLLDLGFTQYEAVATIYALQILLVLSAYLLRYSDDAVLAAAYGGFVVAVSIGLPRLAARSAYLKGRPEGASPIGRFIAHARTTALLTRYPFALLNLAVPFVLVTGALVADAPTEDVGALAAFLLAALLLALTSKAIPFYFLERVTAYVTAVTVALSLERSDAFLAAWRPYLHGCFAVLAAVTALWVRFSSSQFRVTSLDLLVLFIALAVPVLGGPDFRLIGLVALESIILFYAIEVIFAERARHWDLLRLGVLAALAILALKGLRV